MDNLYIDYEQGHILGTKIQNESEELIKLLTKFDEIQDKLKNNFDGSIDAKYTKELFTRTKIMYKLANVVNETGKFLINVSNAYQVTAKAGESRIVQEELM